MRELRGGGSLIFSATVGIGPLLGGGREALDIREAFAEDEYVPFTLLRMLRVEVMEAMPPTAGVETIAAASEP